MDKEEKKRIGKKTHQKGKDFELEVRRDLEARGFIVSRFTNNLDYPDSNINVPPEEREDLKLAPCKPKFNPFTKRVMMMSGGFPDFVAWRTVSRDLNVPDIQILPDGTIARRMNHITLKAYELIGVECKSGKGAYLDREEKGKVNWLIKNEIFSSLLVAYKKDHQIQYKKLETQDL